MTLNAINTELRDRAIAKTAARADRRRASSAKRRACGPDEVLFRATRARAKEKGWDFDLTMEWINGEFLVVTHCQATGIAFSSIKGSSFSRSIDRKDNAKGYTQDNCWAVCWIYNRSKLNGTHDDVITMARALIGRERVGDLRDSAAAQHSVDM